MSIPGVAREQASINEDTKMHAVSEMLKSTVLH